MKIAHFLSDIQWNENKPAISVLMETPTSKEIRIAMKAGQEMKEHKAPYPISVEIIKGSINFGVLGDIHALKEGDLISLDASVPHNLTATEESIVRLSLSKLDSIERVKKV